MCISIHWIDKTEFDLLTRGGKAQKLVVSDFHKMIVQVIVSDHLASDHLFQGEDQL